MGATRVAQQFLMQPPALSASAQRGISGVRVGLDDTYNALWRIEVMNAKGEVSSRFAVESFKKIQDQYIVKRITLTDYSSRDRTTFEVKAAAVGTGLVGAAALRLSYRLYQDFQKVEDPVTALPIYQANRAAFWTGTALVGTSGVLLTFSLLQ